MTFSPARVLTWTREQRVGQSRHIILQRFLPKRVGQGSSQCHWKSRWIPKVCAGRRAGFSSVLPHKTTGKCAKSYLHVTPSTPTRGRAHSPPVPRSQILSSRCQQTLWRLLSKSPHSPRLTHEAAVVVHQYPKRIVPCLVSDTRAVRAQKEICLWGYQPPVESMSLYLGWMAVTSRLPCQSEMLSLSFFPFGEANSLLWSWPQTLTTEYATLWNLTTYQSLRGLTPSESHPHTSAPSLRTAGKPSVAALLHLALSVHACLVFLNMMNRWSRLYEKKQLLYNKYFWIPVHFNVILVIHQ